MFAWETKILVFVVNFLGFFYYCRPESTHSVNWMLILLLLLLFFASRSPSSFGTMNAFWTLYKGGSSMTPKVLVTFFSTRWVTLKTRHLLSSSFLYLVCETCTFMVLAISSSQFISHVLSEKSCCAQYLPISNIKGRQIVETILKHTFINFKFWRLYLTSQALNVFRYSFNTGRIGM